MSKKLNNPVSVLIVLVGKKGSGKSTLAKYLIQNYGFIEYAMAFPLKEIAAIFGFSHKELYGSQEDKETVSPEMGISPREFLQKFGTDICREYLPTILPNLKLGPEGVIWIKLMKQFLMDHTNQCIVISDIRFEDELLAIKNDKNIKHKKLFIYIHRNNRANNSDNHKSENVDSLINMCDCHIDNSFSYEKLYENLENIIKAQHIKLFDKNIVQRSEKI
jgi:GTPase SAR1 family protein